MVWLISPGFVDTGKYKSTLERCHKGGYSGMWSRAALLHVHPN